MLTTVIIVVVVVGSVLAYWWLGRMWPDSKDLQKRIREHRTAARAVLRPKLQNRTRPPDGRPWA